MCFFQIWEKMTRLQNLRPESTTVGRQSRCHQEFTNPQEHFGTAIVFRLDQSVRSSTLSSPLRPLVNKKSVYKWDNVHSSAFEKLKSEIVKIAENSHFDIKEKTRLTTDASQDDQWKTMAFASSFLNNQEMKYSTNELELLSVVWAIERFRNYLYGAEFENVTVHKALLSVNHVKPRK